MTFSATEAAFEGFRVVRRNPLAILFWTLAYLVFFGVAFLLVGSQMAGVMAIAQTVEQGQPNPQDVQSLGQAYVSLMLLVAPLALLIGAVLNAAVARAVLHPAEKAFGFLRLGGDELRVLAVTVILALVIAAFTMVVFAIVTFAAMAAAQVNQGLAVLVAILLGIGGVLATIWLYVRFSLAVPITIAEKRIAPFASFAMTKGQSLPIFGMAIIGFIMSMLVALLGWIISLPVDLSTGGIAKLATLDGQSAIQMLQIAGPGLIGWAVVNAVFSALQLAVLYAPFSAAYRDLKGLPHE